MGGMLRDESSMMTLLVEVGSESIATSEVESFDGGKCTVLIS